MKRICHISAICLVGLMTACGGVGNIGNTGSGSNPGGTKPGGGSDSSPHFSPTGSLVRAQFMHSSTLLPDGRVLIVCGSPGAADYPTVDVEIFDLSTHTFRSLPMDLRTFCTATLLRSGMVLVAGGQTANYPQTFTNTAELFDPTTGLFQTTGSMTVPRTGHTATLLADGKVLIAGGRNNDGITQTAEIYDPATGTFLRTGDMVAARWGHTATLLANGKVLVTGGRSQPGGDAEALTTAELYDPGSGTFSPTGSLMIARSGHTATLLPSGQVFFVGGVAGPTDDNLSVQIDPTTEIYDPSAGRFSYAGKMISPRIQQTATLLTNGTVLIVGGWTTDQNGDYHTTASAEIYDPVTSSFSPAGSLAMSRGLHSAVALADGTVLITGGTYAEPPGTPFVLNTAEIFK